MVSKHMKRRSTSLVTWEKKTETTIRDQHTVAEESGGLQSTGSQRVGRGRTE